MLKPPRPHRAARTGPTGRGSRLVEPNVAPLSRLDVDGHPVAYRDTARPKIQGGGGQEMSFAHSKMTSSINDEGQAYLFSGPRGTARDVGAHSRKGAKCERRSMANRAECDSARRRKARATTCRPMQRANNGAMRCANTSRRLRWARPVATRVHPRRGAHDVEGGRGRNAEDPRRNHPARRLRVAPRPPKGQRKLRSRTQHRQFHLLPRKVEPANRWMAPMRASTSRLQPSRRCWFKVAVRPATHSALELVAASGAKHRGPHHSTSRRGVHRDDPGPRLAVGGHAVLRARAAQLPKRSLVPARLLWH